MFVYSLVGQGYGFDKYVTWNQNHSKPQPCVCTPLYVTELAKRGLLHTSDFPSLMRHNFICKQPIRLKFLVLLVQC